jgi:hypothetical protein
MVLLLQSLWSTCCNWLNLRGLCICYFVIMYLMHLGEFCIENAPTLVATGLTLVAICSRQIACNTLILLKIGFIKNLLETFNCLWNIRLLYFLLGI